MTTYLEDAAAEIVRVRGYNEARRYHAAELREMRRPDQAAAVEREVADRSERIAALSLAAAAIEAGLLPPCCHVTQDAP